MIWQLILGISLNDSYYGSRWLNGYSVKSNVCLFNRQLLLFPVDCDTYKFFCCFQSNVFDDEFVSWINHAVHWNAPCDKLLPIASSQFLQSCLQCDKVSEKVMTPHKKNVLMWCISLCHDWFETNLRHWKHYSESGQKNCGCCRLLERVVVGLLFSWKKKTTKKQKTKKQQQWKTNSDTLAILSMSTDWCCQAD